MSRNGILPAPQNSSQVTLTHKSCIKKWAGSVLVDYGKTADMENDSHEEAYTTDS